MTQPVIATAPVAAAPVAAPIAAAPTVSASEMGEPTIEELAALIEKPAEPTLEEVAADAPVEAEPVVEPVVEEPSDKTEPAADAALERATKAAEKARAGSRRYAETQRQLSEQNARLQHAAREADQLRRENAGARAREEARLKDPYKALKDQGMTDQQLAERALRENSPEAVVLRLQEQVEQERTARLALEKRLESERHEAIREANERQANAAFTALADNEAAYPRLSQLNADAQLDVAQAAMSRIAKNGYDIRRLSNAQVAEACEKYLAPKRAGASTAPVVPFVKPVVTAKPVVKTSGKTLTNQQAQTRTVAPASWDTLSEDQQLASIAASLPEPAG